MESILNKEYVHRLKEAGFTAEQAEAVLYTIEQRSVTKKDLELLTKDLKLWTLGVMISGFVLFAGFISYLDSQTNARLDNMEARSNERFDKIDERFNTIEADIKTLLLINSPNSLKK